MNKNLYLRNFIASLPVLIFIIVGFVFLGISLNLNPSPLMIGIGALGWYLALMLRMPFIILFKKLSLEKSRPFTILLSGPAEETVRLIMLFVFVKSISEGYYLGLGWASIEIFYSVIQGFLINKLNERTDRKALKAKKMLQRYGMEKSMEPDSPFWGIVERLFASAGHISFTLLLFWNPLIIIVTLPLHSLSNLIAIKLLKRSFWLTEGFIGCLFTTLFLASLFINGLL
jgi:hypothetical protein